MVCRMPKNLVRKKWQQSEYANKLMHFKEYLYWDEKKEESCFWASGEKIEPATEEKR